MLEYILKAVKLGAVALEAEKNFSRNLGKFEEKSFIALTSSIETHGFDEGEGLLNVVELQTIPVAFKFKPSFEKLDFDRTPEGAKTKVIVTVYAAEVIAEYERLAVKSGPAYSIVAGFRRFEALLWALVLAKKVGTILVQDKLTMKVYSPLTEDERKIVCLRENPLTDEGRAGLSKVDLYAAAMSVWDGKEATLMKVCLMKRGMAQQYAVICRIAAGMAKLGDASVDQGIRNGTIKTNTFDKEAGRELSRKVELVASRAVPGIEDSPEVTDIRAQVADVIKNPAKGVRAQAASAKDCQDTAKAANVQIIADCLMAVAGNDLGRLTKYRQPGVFEVINAAVTGAVTGTLKIVEGKITASTEV
jgi:hypothetical protein